MKDINKLHDLEVPQEFSVRKTPKKQLEHWYRLMTIGRIIDEKAPNYLKQALGWSYHAPYAGHDGIQLAIGQVFKKEQDYFFPYYRDMLSCLSAGMSAEELILNGLSKAADPSSGGRHMSNHFAKPEINIENVSSNTGNHTLHAVGVARSLKYYKDDGVAMSSQGESSVSEGYVYEAINGASKEKLPVIFVFQDNGYGISVPKRDQTARRKVADNFRGFKNLRIIHCNGKDVFDSMNAMYEAHRWAKENQMPCIVHANCVRIHSHSNSDKHDLYRDKDELTYSKSYDPLAKFERMLSRYGHFSEEELTQIKHESRDVVNKAHRKVIKAEAPSGESIFDFVIPDPYVSTKYPEGIHEYDGPNKKLIEALNETLKAEFRHNPETFLYGQDMANKEKGGVFNVSKGMQHEFGKERIFNGPIAEDYIVGTANGMSRYKKQNIHVVIEGAEFADYFWPAMEQFVESSHDYWRSNGKFAPNMTIRLASGGYIGGGIYHSQNIEGCLTTFPGVRIVYPSYADDAAGLLRTSIRSKGMTMFLEPKALYNADKTAAPIPEDFEVPFGKLRVRKAGEDLSVFTYGNTSPMCVEVANELQNEGYNIEVIDLRSLIPLDIEGIKASVRKTNKAIVIHEDKIFSGFGAEIVSQIMESCFEDLDGPVKRIGATFTPVGFNPVFEKATLPNTQIIKDAIIDTLKY
ncbi:thiamine pyrophosphate-dependent enzyme [Prolixibacteraceae bacterium]|nr:thiamine pyrophosphate-dependent enzyme [Prolixibacteraceae bacterium]